jgi:uncharacterized protein YfbU (UPF0304 family)
MELRPADKLIIAMLCDIYKHLGIEGDINPAFIKNTLYSGQYWGLDWEYDALLQAQPPAEHVVKETADILFMWMVLERSYNNLSGEEKKRIRIEAEPFGNDVRFRGFDANNERHFGVAQYLIEHLDRFPDFEGRYLNSHSQVVDVYKRMNSVFEPIVQGLHGKDLDADHIIQVLKASRYPE